MTIIIDTRERYSVVAKIFFDSHNIDIHETCLSADHYTDYLIVQDNKTLGVQRKSIGEVINQMQDIRERIHTIVKVYDRCVLLVEEDFTISENGFIIRKTETGNFETKGKVVNYYNFLQSLRDDGAEVITTKNYEQSLWWIYATHERMKTMHVPKIHARNHTPLEEAIGMLCSISGFGIKSCEKILDINTISDLIEMNDNELSSIGFNKTQIKRFKESINVCINPPDKKSNNYHEIFSKCDTCDKNFRCEDCLNKEPHDLSI